MVAKNKKQTKN